MEGEGIAGATQARADPAVDLRHHPGVQRRPCVVSRGVSLCIQMD